VSGQRGGLLPLGTTFLSFPFLSPFLSPKMSSPVAPVVYDMPSTFKEYAETLKSLITKNPEMAKYVTAMAYDSGLGRTTIDNIYVNKTDVYLEEDCGLEDHRNGITASTGSTLQELVDALFSVLDRAPNTAEYPMNIGYDGGLGSSPVSELVILYEKNKMVAYIT
jgi:hypothetical protein